MHTPVVLEVIYASMDHQRMTPMTPWTRSWGMHKCQSRKLKLTRPSDGKWQFPRFDFRIWDWNLENVSQKINRMKIAVESLRFYNLPLDPFQYFWNIYLAQMIYQSNKTVGNEHFQLYHVSYHFLFCCNQTSLLRIANDICFSNMFPFAQQPNFPPQQPVTCQSPRLGSISALRVGALGRSNGGVNPYKKRMQSYTKRHDDRMIYLRELEVSI